MSLIPNDEDRARQAGFTQGAAMAEAENARLRAEIDRLRGLLTRMLQWDQFNPPMTGDHAWWKQQIRDALAGAADQPAATLECAHDGDCTFWETTAMSGILCHVCGKNFDVHTYSAADNAADQPAAAQCDHAWVYSDLARDWNCTKCGRSGITADNAAAQPAAAHPNALAGEAGDARLGRIAMRFVDRAGDYCEVDPAERICDEFSKAMGDEIERQWRERMARDAFDFREMHAKYKTRATDSAPAGPARYSPNEHAQRCDNCGKSWVDHKQPDELCPTASADAVLHQCSCGHAWMAPQLPDKPCPACNTETDNG